MRRTLLAVGIAILVSIIFAPHKEGWEFLGRMFYVKRPAILVTPEPYWSAYYGRYVQGAAYYSNTSYTPYWCTAWHWFPIFWLEDRNPILWANFAGQTAFVAVLAAVLVHIPWQPKSKRT